MTLSPDHAAAIAAHRFGLGEARLDVVGGDAAGWLLGQIGPADPHTGDGLAATADALRRYDDFARQRRENPDAKDTTVRDAVQADQRARLLAAATTQRPFAERLALFWTNHFTVSLTKGELRGVVGAYEREAIRPHIAGSFEQLLKAAVMHPAMLRYLDNDQSAGPQSKVAQQQARKAGKTGQPARITGLNENLGREVLELHTLGAEAARQGVYTQADVTSFAAVLTGWRATAADGATRFNADWHQPGDKTVLGRRYPAGPEALPAVLRDLSVEPATARFVCTKLARHVVADEPPPALIDRLVRAWQRSAGDLPAVYRALVEAPEAWQPAPQKLKTPEEFAVSAARVLRLPDTLWLRQPDAGVGGMGQPLQTAPSPAGWPDRAADWLGPEALWKRIEWTSRIADRIGRQADARAIAQASLGWRLADDSARQIARAADGPQALSLLLLSPDFQRR